MAANAETLTDDEIASLAERMSNEGRAVTPVSVWSDLRRGSIVDIAAALQRWRDARQPQEPVVSANAALPQELGESVLSVAQRLWVVAREETDKVHNQRASVVNQRLSTALADRDEALAEFQRVEAQGAADRRQLTDAQGELRVAADLAARLREDLAAANDRAERSQTLVGEMMQHASVEEDKLKAATASLDDERRAHEASRAELKSKEDEIARQAQELSAAAVRAEAASADAQQSATRLAQLQSELNEAQNALENERSATAARLSQSLAQHDEFQRITRELEQARAQLELAKDDKAAANEELAWVRQDASTARGEASTARDHAAQLESQIAELSRNDAAAQAELTRLAQELAAARDHSSGLEQQLAERGHADASSQAEQSRLSQELSAARERLADVERQLSERAQGESASQAEQARLSQELAAARERSAQLEQQLTQRGEGDAATRDEIARLTEEVKVARDEATRLQEQFAQRDRDDAAAKESRRVQDQALQSRVSAAEQEVVRLQRQIADQAKTHAKSYDELRSNAEQWVTYAKDLKQRLDISSEKMVFIDARSTGEVALLRRLSSELERLKPDHELVFREAQQKLIGEKMSQQLAQKGYRYDPATAVMTKIES